MQAEVLQKYEGHITIVPRLSLHVLQKVLVNPTPEELEWFAVEGEKCVWPYLSIIRSHLRIELALHRATRAMRDVMRTPRASPVLPLHVQSPRATATGAIEGEAQDPLLAARRPLALAAAPPGMSSAGASAAISPRDMTGAKGKQPSPTLFVRPGHEGLPTTLEHIPPRHRSPPPAAHSPGSAGSPGRRTHALSPPILPHPGCLSTGSTAEAVGQVLPDSTADVVAPTALVPSSSSSPASRDSHGHCVSRRLSSVEASAMGTTGLGAFAALEHRDVTAAKKVDGRRRAGSYTQTDVHYA